MLPRERRTSVSTLRLGPTGERKLRELSESLSLTKSDVMAYGVDLIYSFKEAVDELAVNEPEVVKVLKAAIAPTILNPDLPRDRVKDGLGELMTKVLKHDLPGKSIAYLILKTTEIM